MKSLLDQFEGVSLDPHTHIKVRHSSACLWFQREGGETERDRRAPETHWPSSPAESENDRFSERLGLKKKIKRRGIGKDTRC